MDLRLFFGVIRRSKFLVIGGTVVGLLLAILAYGTPKLVNGKPTVIPHGQEVWEAQSNVLITYAGFPYGRTQNPTDPSLTGLSSLSVVYANLADSDQVTQKVLTGTPTGSQVKAQPVYDPNSGLPEPIVNIATTASTGTDARKLADRAALALQSYVSQQQNASDVPVTKRIELDILQKDATVTLVKGHKPTIPVLVFLAILTAVVTLAFARDNTRGGRQRNIPAPAGHGVLDPRGYRLVAVRADGRPGNGDAGVAAAGFLPNESLSPPAGVTSAPGGGSASDWAPESDVSTVDDPVWRDGESTQPAHPTATLEAQSGLKPSTSVFRRRKRPGPEAV